MLDSEERGRENTETHSLWQSGISGWSYGDKSRVFCCCVFLLHWNSALEVPEKRNLCSGKISSTCLRWKLVDLKRW